MTDARYADAERARVGLCARCRHASVQLNARGSAFWRCRRAEEDDALHRYPPLPVRACHAHKAGEPERRGS
jgi:hypothetical protein